MSGRPASSPALLPPFGSLVVVALTAIAPVAHGWELDGGSICYAAHSQLTPEVVPDGIGGAVVVWIDTRNGPGSDVYAQRVDTDGAPYWTLQGVPVCAATGDQDGIVVVPDGAGGAFIAWTDYRNADADIYAQRIGPDGGPIWELDGVAVATADHAQDEPVMVADGTGGVILAWQDGRNFADDLSLDVYAQRLDALGVAQWTTGGRAVVSVLGAQRHPALLADGTGGAFIAWEDRRDHTFENDLYYDIYASRLTPAGGAAFEVTVISAVYDQSNPILASAPGGDALVFWNESRHLTPDVYGSRITAAGGVLFPNDIGTSITGSGHSEYLAAAVPDGSGGAIVFWRDVIDTARDLRVQRVDGDLAHVWTPGGLILCDAEEPQDELRAVSDGGGGALVVWQDRRNGLQEDIYAQRVDTAGTPLWGDDGAPVCLDPARQLFPVICGDGLGGALFAWHEQRQGTPGDIWGHHLDADGAPVPVLVPWHRAEWQGGAVVVSWRLVGGDEPPTWRIERAVWPGNASEVLLTPVRATGADTWRFRDAAVTPGTAYRYRVWVGGSPLVEELFVTDPVAVPPPTTMLSPPHPNPGNPATRVAITLARTQRLNMAVFDAAGRRVAQLADGTFAAGRHVFRWDGRGADGRSVPTGTYLVRLVGDRSSAVRKLQLLR